MSADIQIMNVAGLGLDPITVFWQNDGIGKGSVTITCYGEAWTAWFGAMSGRTIQEFFREADVLYMVNKLHGSQFQKDTAGHRKYLARIVEAIKSDLVSFNYPVGPDKRLTGYAFREGSAYCFLAESGNPSAAIKLDASELRALIAALQAVQDQIQPTPSITRDPIGELAMMAERAEART